MDNYKQQLSKSPDLDDVYYEFGKDIWDYYDDGSINSELIRDTALDNSQQPFRITVDNTDNATYRKNSNMYLDIAKFKLDATQLDKATEDDDDAVSPMQQYVTRLNELYDEVKSEPANKKKLKLNACIIIQDALTKNATNFRKSGVAKKEVLDLCDNVKSLLNELSFNSDKYEQARNYCISSINSAASAIQIDYDSKVAGK